VILFIVVLDVLLTNAIKQKGDRGIKIRVKHPVYHHTFKINSKSKEQYRHYKYTIFGGGKNLLFLLIHLVLKASHQGKSH